MFFLTTIRRLIVAVIGGTVLLFGLILLVTPGPAFVVIPVGLAILAITFLLIFITNKWGEGRPS